VRINSIQLDSFRNIENQKIDLCPGMNLFIGNNGQGKTNILEAIHMLSSLRSFRNSRISEMICHGKTNAQLSASVQKNNLSLDLKLELDFSGRKIWVGNKQARSISDYLGKLAVVAFTPDDLLMIKGAPANRRRFMDRSCFLIKKSHLDAVKSFNASLKSRNKILSSGEFEDIQLLDSFSSTFSKWGWMVSKNRKELVEQLENDFSDIIEELSDKELSGKLRYICGWKDGPGSDADHLFGKLKDCYERDKFRKSTSIGPQLDDFDVLLHMKKARKFGSQGQQRSCAVALLLSIVNIITELGMERPIILMDDISSELDSNVRKRLFEIIKRLNAQTIVTTTEESLIDDLVPQSLFRVKKGTVKVES